MRDAIERKINEIKARPEHRRHRAVVVITLVAGVIILVVWALLLLPAQLQ